MKDRTNLGDILPRETPDHPLFIDLRAPDQPKTWRTDEFDRATDAVAEGLHHRGFAPGARIAILAANRAEYLIAYFGTMRAGMVTVPINFKLPKETIDYIFHDADIAAVFVDADRRSLVPAGYPTLDLDVLDAERRAPRAECRVPSTEIAKILYTSGSTGRPKGVPLPHAGQIWSVAKYFEGTEHGRQEITLVVAPTYHKNGLFFSMMALANQMTVVSLPRFEARSYLETVAKYRCTLLTGIPTMFALIAREHDLIQSLDFSSVRLVTIGSAPLTDGLVARVTSIFPNAEVRNGYGTTEAGPIAFGPHPAGLPRPLLALGYPFPEIQWRLVDGPAPNEGVLELKTPALMPGYLNLPEATAEKLRDGWYSTGDVMRHDDEGFFYFVSRADDMFICGGENIFPGEVEKLLERHSAVSQAAVVPVPDEIKGQIPVAFVVKTPGAVPTEAELKTFTLEHGPAFAHPRFVIFVDLIPVAGTHKVDRRDLIVRATAEARSRGRL